MCGICGIVNLDGSASNEQAVRAMMHGIRHRGPDDAGTFTESNISLGFVRLSIIDLSAAGHQPMTSFDERYVIVFNGEIYNYIELRKQLQEEGIVFKSNTDTEVLLNSYLFWGESCLERFNGMWAFAIYDRREKTVFAARDRFGVKPFYYLNVGNVFAFCSEIPPLLGMLKGKPEPDRQSIFDFLVFNKSDQNENTFFKIIKKLPQGSTLNIREGKIQIRKWYDLREKVSRVKGFESASDFKKMLSASIDLRLRSDVPVGVCLSGGLDSSSIVSLLLEDFGKKELQTFSAIYQKGQIGDESEFIDVYRSKIKNMFFVQPGGNDLINDLKAYVRTHAEPIAATGPYAQYKVMQLAQGKVTVTLDGQGADEELAGYHYFFGFYFKDLLRRLRLLRMFSEIFHYLRIHKSTFGLKTFFYFLLPQGLRTKISVRKNGYLQADFIKQYSKDNAIASTLYAGNTLQESLLDHFEYKLQHLLKYSDRNSMRFSIEARVPFLDYRLVEKLLATDSKWLIQRGMTKFILREAMKGLVPENIRMRRDKMGFSTPEDEWFREPAWQKLVFEILESPNFASRGFIRPEIAIAQYKAHLSGKKNISKEIWKWVHLELWFREFID